MGRLTDKQLDSALSKNQLECSTEPACPFVSLFSTVHPSYLLLLVRYLFTLWACPQTDSNTTNIVLLQSVIWEHGMCQYKTITQATADVQRNASFCSYTRMPVSQSVDRLTRWKFISRRLRLRGGHSHTVHDRSDESRVSIRVEWRPLDRQGSRCSLWVGGTKTDVDLGIMVDFPKQAQHRSRTKGCYDCYEHSEIWRHSIICMTALQLRPGVSTARPPSPSPSRWGFEQTSESIKCTRAENCHLGKLEMLRKKERAVRRE